MWRDPLDELIEDLEQVVKPVPAIRQVPPFELFIEISDRIIRAGRYHTSQPRHDPEAARLLARLLSYRGEEPSPAPASPGPKSDVSDKNGPTLPAPSAPGRDSSTT